ncbi:MAG: bifunctional DNA primase/polymerase [Desulfovibrio sp.]|jgi:hypothetical protein|nr:bifunctional DNA primase/polymerase [Desulfovibrio sp.]
MSIEEDVWTAWEADRARYAFHLAECFAEIRAAGLDGRTREGSLEVALVYARHGIAVFPVRADKHPCTRAVRAEDGGLRHVSLVADATTDEATITGWWNAHLPPAWAAVYHAGVGILDIDVKGGSPGLESLSRLEGEHNIKLPLMVRTPSGGFHVPIVSMFGGPSWGFKGGPIAGYPGLEIRTGTSYALLPGSWAQYVYGGERMEGAYTVTDELAAPVEIPEALWELLHRPAPAQTSLPCTVCFGSPNGGMRNLDIARRVAQKYAAAGPGERHGLLIAAARNFGHACAAGEASLEDAIAELVPANAGYLREHGRKELERNIRKSFEHGVAHPWTPDPPKSAKPAPVEDAALPLITVPGKRPVLVVARSAEAVRKETADMDVDVQEHRAAGTPRSMRPEMVRRFRAKEPEATVTWLKSIPGKALRSWLEAGLMVAHGTQGGIDVTDAENPAKNATTTASQVTAAPEDVDIVRVDPQEGIDSEVAAALEELARLTPLEALRKYRVPHGVRGEAWQPCLLVLGQIPPDVPEAVADALGAKVREARKDGDQALINAWFGCGRAA